MFAVVNAVTFLLIAPNVNDIWAALARQSAATDGVGLTYWFSWFGGGTTPGNYSLLTPYVSALVGAGVLGAIATALLTPLTSIAVRETRHPTAAVWVATICAALNLWSGRVPFALGCAFGVATLIAVRRRRLGWAIAGVILAVAASPVAGVFVGIGLAGTTLVRADLRRICLITDAAIGLSLIAVALVFGSPGPEQFGWVSLVQLAVSVALFRLAAPPDYVRATMWLVLVVEPLVYLVPNGMGDNLLRLGWACLPAVVVATAERAVATAVLTVVLAVGFFGRQTVHDLVGSTNQTASVAYYDTLIKRLAPLRHQLGTYRLEIADDGTHTAAYALLGHAMLARGWETQEDHALNKAVISSGLDATTYKIWLQDNAVGFVAIASDYRTKMPEYALVADKRPGYLSEIWSDPKWTLFRVRAANPLVKPPVSVASFTQSRLVLHVPCACSFTVRVRFSKYLGAVTSVAHSAPPSAGVSAKLVDDGFGWTTMTTPEPGNYTLSGSLTGGLLRR